LVKGGKWEDALVLAEHGLSKVDAEPRKELHRWRNGVFLRWAEAVGKDNVDNAVDILKKGMAVDPEEHDFANNLGCLAHDRAKQLDATGRRDEAKAFVEAMQQRFDKCNGVQKAGAWFVQDVTDGLIEHSKFQEALKALDYYSALIKEQRDADTVVLRIYNAEAKPHEDKMKWPDAIAVFEKGLKRFPQHAGLKQNLEYCQAMARK
jgi:tetratricopeptide (TPR) repeat protein